MLKMREEKKRKRDRLSKREGENHKIECRDPQREIKKK